MKIKYVHKRFGAKALNTIQQANDIISEYEASGFDLTLRQLYYQFVSRDLIENNMRAYKNLGEIINSGRLAGHISWDAIVDRTRNLEGNPHWQNPGQFMESVVPQFQTDKWSNQPNRVEVWIEKDALVGIAERICRQLDVSYFSCRGYTSQSEMHSAALRLKRFSEEQKQTPIIIHLGDHDPSGIDMSRDIAERLELFMGGLKVDRIALNLDQVKKYKPPPNPAKITDTRARGYIKQFGAKSWELDALDPKVLSDLIKKTVLSYRDSDLWEDALALEAHYSETLEKISEKLKDTK